MKFTVNFFTQRCGFFWHFFFPARDILCWMKHETGSAEFLSSTLDSAHGGVAIFPEYLTTGPRYLDLPPRQGENQTKMLNLQKYYDSGILSSSCMRGFVILFWQEIKTCSSSPFDINFLHPMEVCRTAKKYLDYVNTIFIYSLISQKMLSFC